MKKPFRIFKKKNEGKLIDLNEKKQLKLINIIFKDCNSKLKKIIDEFEKGKWDKYIKQEEPISFFYWVTLIELYLYEGLIKDTYSEKTYYNIFITLLNEYANMFKEDSNSFAKKVSQDMIDIDKFIDIAIKKDIDLYSALFAYLTNKSCEVPSEVYLNSYETTSLFVPMILADISNEFPELIKKI